MWRHSVYSLKKWCIFYEGRLFILFLSFFESDDHSLIFRMFLHRYVKDTYFCQCDIYRLDCVYLEKNMCACDGGVSTSEALPR